MGQKTDDLWGEMKGERMKNGEWRMKNGEIINIQGYTHT